LLKVFESTALDTLAKPWLSLQCRMITGVERGAVILGAPGNGNLIQATYWPAKATPNQGLSDIAKEAIEKQKGVIREGNKAIGEAGKQFDYLAYPLRISGHLVGVVAIEVLHRPVTKQKADLEALQWGCAWLSILLRQQAAAINIRLVNILELLIHCLETESFQDAATSLVTEAAVRLDCERVSLGLVKGKQIEVTALSHSANFNKKSVLLQHIGAAMDEAVDQDASVIYPSKVSTQVVNAHKALANHEADHTVCTVPLVHDGEMFGAMTFERNSDHAFDKNTVELCEQLAMLTGPILRQKKENDKWIGFKLVTSFRNQLAKLFGANHVWFKTVVASIAVAVILLSTLSGEYRVTSSAMLEGKVQRIVVAPIEGYITAAPARAGDIVKKGDLLVTMEDKDLIIEKVKWSGKLEENKSEYRSAMAEHDRTKVGILNAQLAQAEAQLRLINEKLQRTKIRVPIDGIIVQGDLSQSLGAPVKQGEHLFVIAPLEDYRVILQVDERDIGNIETGQTGKIALTSLPKHPLNFEVTRVTPVSTAEKGANYFRVEAKLQETPSELRPGMLGIGKISIGERKWIWIWTHTLTEWVRLKLWFWLP